MKLKDDIAEAMANLARRKNSVFLGEENTMTIKWPEKNNRVNWYKPDNIQEAREIGFANGWNDCLNACRTALEEACDQEMLAKTIHEAFWSTKFEEAVEIEKELAGVINKHCMENASNTPDFILAQYLMSCFKSFNTTMQQREIWYSRDARPSKDQKADKLVEALREVIKTIKGNDNWWIACPDKGGFDLDKLECTLIEYEKGQVKA